MNPDTFNRDRSASVQKLLDRIEELEFARDEAIYAARMMSLGKPIGPLIESQTIVRQEREIEKLKRTIAEQDMLIIRAQLRRSEYERA